MNKKTIKFYDKDAADHKFGQGGGGFVVKFTKNAQDEVTCDKTFAEISAKIAAGNDVIGYVTGADGMTYAMLPTIKAGTSGVVFSAAFYNDQNKGVVYQVECCQSEGHDFFEWSVVELAGGGGDTPVEITLTEDNFAIEDSKKVGDISYAYLTNFSITLDQPVDVKNKNLAIVFEAGGDVTQFSVIAYQYVREGQNFFIVGVCAYMFELPDEDLIEYGAKLVIY